MRREVKDRGGVDKGEGERETSFIRKKRDRERIPSATVAWLVRHVTKILFDC